MKLNYYGYCFADISTGQRTLMSVEGFLRAFCQFNNADYKNSFNHNGEHVFLLNTVGSLYLFVQTRSHELIKKIDSQDITVGEIYDLLDADELLGFASYVYLRNSYLGFASTVMAPRISAFASFVNAVLHSISLGRYQFTLVPLLSQATRAEVLNMAVVGKSVIQVNRSNGLFGDFVDMLQGRAEDFVDVDSFEVVLRPKRKKDISGAVNRVLNRVPDEGLEKLVVKAKNELDGALVDYYLAGNGLIADRIDTKDERIIADRIRERVETNAALHGKVTEYEQNETFSHVPIDGLNDYSDVRAWAVALSRV